MKQKTKRTVVLAIIAIAATCGPAAADPITGAIMAFSTWLASGTLAATLTSFALQAALSIPADDRMHIAGDGE